MRGGTTTKKIPEPAAKKPGLPPRTHNGEAWEVHRDREAARNRAKSAAGRDIGPIPPVENPERRADGASSLRRFCEIYGSAVFQLAWGENHLEELRRMEDAIRNGGLFAMADPRGDGKTTRCEWSVLFAMLNGHRRFLVLVGATEGHAEELLDSIKTEIESNDLLLADYPEVCFPVRALDGIVARSHGQTSEGERTRIEWKDKQVVLPTVRGSAASGGIVRVAGITGRVRGMNFKRSDGASVRPDFVICDDPQTDESARSLTQNRQREAILAGAILGMAGPGKRISGFMPCTVIEPGDMADRILDRKLHPEWYGMRTAMVKAWPKRMDLWDRYIDMRRESKIRDGKGEEATAFYAENREAMDEGASLSWPARMEPGDLSALQHAMNKLSDHGRTAFFAEYQNQPLPQESSMRTDLTAEDIMQRVNGVQRRMVPQFGSRLTAFVDVQESCLWWMVCAWGDGFTGAVVDYGAWPEQPTAHFTMRELRRTLATEYRQAATVEGRWYEGLQALGQKLVGHEWLREDGASMRVERLLVDANYPKSADIVRQWCRSGDFASVAMPSHGKYVGASSLPFDQYKRRPGERLGLNWLVRRGARNAVQHVSFDTNWWKTFVYSRMATSRGDKGALTLHGRDADVHRMLAEQLTAERPVPVESKGRRVDEWKAVPGRDNHMLDCLVGCAVAASMAGIALSVGSGVAVDGVRQGGRRRVNLSDWRKGKR